MSDTVRVCPECDSSRPRLSAPGGYQKPSGAGGRFRCPDCGARPDELVERENKAGHRNGGGSLAAKLHEADPDEWP